jgi:hypothetical protein
VLPASASARGALLLQLLCEYADRFAAMLDGTCVDLPVSELAGELLVLGGGGVGVAGAGCDVWPLLSAAAAA